MAVQLLYLLLIIITSTITNLAGGELMLQMPLSINPVVQEVITERGEILTLFYATNTEYYSKLSPVDMVISLEQSLSKVMRNTVSGAVVLGIAAKNNGLTTDKLIYNARNRWTVNVSLSEIRAVLTADEEYLYPISDNITLSKLQNLGLRVLGRKYNVSVENQTDALHSSNAITFRAVEQDWIDVVKYITKTKLVMLAEKYDVNMDILAKTLNLTSSELFNVTLGQLDGILAKDLHFLLSTNPPTTDPPTTRAPTVPTTSPTPPEISLPTSQRVGSASTAKATHPIISTASGKPTEGKSEGTTKINLALFVGVAVGLLLLFLASSSVWCFRRKRRDSTQNEKSSKNDVKLNNLWLDKSQQSVSRSPEEPYRAEQSRFVRSASTSALGVDSRFKGLRYSAPRPTSMSFAPSTNRVPISRSSFIYDSRKEIFV